MANILKYFIPKERKFYAMFNDAVDNIIEASIEFEKLANASLEPGDHGTTYGGNPFVCAAVGKVFDIFVNVFVKKFCVMF